MTATYVSAPTVLTLVLPISWSVFAAFALVRQLTIHTFSLVQSKLIPVYLYCLMGCNVVSLAVYAVYHPRELLDWHESVQVEHHICTFLKHFLINNICK